MQIKAVKPTVAPPPAAAAQRARSTPPPPPLVSAAQGANPAAIAAAAGVASVNIAASPTGGALASGATVGCSAVGRLRDLGQGLDWGRPEEPVSRLRPGLRGGTAGLEGPDMTVTSNAI